MTELKCPFCGEILQKYGEVDPDTGTSIVLGANCRKCGIGDSDIKLWQALIDTKKKLDIAVDALKKLSLGNIPSLPDDETLSLAMCNYARDTLKQIKDKEE